MGGLAISAWPSVSEAQNIQMYFPSGTTGYDRELGITVLSRLHPLYETPSLHVGSFVVIPSFDESLFYNSNVNGIPGSSSWGSRTSGSLGVRSDWDRNSLAASLGFSHNQFFSFPNESFTDWNVGLAGGYTIGDGSIQAGYAHQTYHQIGVSIGTISSTTPVQNQVDSAHLDYTLNFSRFTVVPDISISAYRYGTATVLGVPLNQQFLDRDVFAGGVTTRYSMSDVGSLLLVARGLASDFVSPTPGQPSNNSDSFLLLGGFDYQAKGVWRYRLLAGVEVRTFQASVYPTHTGPIIEGSVIWTPTELTTLTGTLSRTIEDPQTVGTNGYTLTQGQLVVDHELRRNVFLQMRGSVQYAQYLQTGGGSQAGFSGGGRATWLLSRRLRLSADYTFTKITGSSTSLGSFNQSIATGGQFTQSLLTITLHLAL